MHKYKAVIFDLDGTAIPNKSDGMPSERLIEVVQKAKKDFIVTVATGRPITNSRLIIQSLKIESPCLISGGTQIIDPKTEKTLWEKIMPQELLAKIIDVCRPYPYVILFDNELLSDPESVAAVSKKINSDRRIVYIMTVRFDDAKKIVSELDSIVEIKAIEVPSWTPGCVDVHITHAEATKQRGLAVLFEMLKVQRSEVVGIGDANNDLPLFKSVGYKVAMGNGTEEMRSEADFIAPSMEEDGVAFVIQQLIDNKLDV